jgi:hypothetical protein
MTTNRHGTKVYLDPDMMDFLRSEAKRRRIPWNLIIRELLLKEMELKGWPTEGKKLKNE